MGTFECQMCSEGSKRGASPATLHILCMCSRLDQTHLPCWKSFSGRPVCAESRLGMVGIKLWDYNSTLISSHTVKPHWWTMTSVFGRLTDRFTWVDTQRKTHTQTKRCNTRQSELEKFLIGWKSSRLSLQKRSTGWQFSCVNERQMWVWAAWCVFVCSDQWIYTQSQICMCASMLTDGNCSDAGTKYWVSMRCEVCVYPEWDRDTHTCTHVHTQVCGLWHYVCVFFSPVLAASPHRYSQETLNLWQLLFAENSHAELCVCVKRKVGSEGKEKGKCHKTRRLIRLIQRASYGLQGKEKKVLDACEFE